MTSQAPQSETGQDAKRWWSLSIDQTLAELHVDPASGLSDAEAAQRLNRYGRNELAEEPPVPVWKRVFAHINELVVWILVAAAVIAVIVGDWIDAVAILAIVVLNVAIGFFQEQRAGRALAALRRLSSPMADVIRSRTLQSIAAAELAPGDILDLEAGDYVPADVRLLETHSFRTQEAALTGESVPVEKDADCALEENAALADQRNMAFMSTTIAAGRSRGVVIGTGMSTEVGKIAGLLQQYEQEPTPLQRRLAGLGRVLIVVCLAVVAVVFALQLYRGGDFWDVLLLSVSLAVAAVPEGMPAVVTLTLALGLQRMVKRNALIRKLPSVETLGAVTVICTDKTGTLTRNEMTVRQIVAGGTRYDVTGTGYAPHGEFVERTTADAADVEDDPKVNAVVQTDLVQTLTVGAKCNRASLNNHPDLPDNWTIVGDPTEGALLVAARKAGIEVSDDDDVLLHEIPFDSERKAMSVVYRGDGSRPRMYAKGAPEVILGKCSTELSKGSLEPLTESRRDAIKSDASDMASRALRVLALAYRDFPDGREADFVEEQLVFAGMVGMIDPPREEATDAVTQCRAAGIRPVMITGDHPATAHAIAREIGVAEPDDQLITGVDLDQLSDDELAENVASICVYARVSAAHKLRVIEAWQSRGAVVAMTGDGVNDAPAVKKADIGVAMGVTGSDVTKESADMVLTDDNFASIISAVEEGRGIFDNIQKFVHYLLSCNAGEVLLMFFAGLAGWPAPLRALQILWINLVTDGLPALALGMEPAEKGVMRRPPRPSREPVITWARGIQILSHGTLMAVTAIAAFWWIYRSDEQRLVLAQSAVFCIVAYMQLFYSLCCRSQRDTMPEIGFFTNRYLVAAIIASALIQFVIATTPAFASIFGMEQGVLSQWKIILLASLTPVTLIELSKLLRRWIGERHKSPTADVHSPT